MQRESPQFRQRDTVRILPLRAQGTVRWNHFEEEFKGGRWLYYVEYIDHEGLRAARYFTGFQLERADGAAAAALGER